MKILISTFYGGNNFGAALQAFALKYRIDSFINKNDRCDILRTANYSTVFPPVILLVKNFLKKGGMSVLQWWKLNRFVNTKTIKPKKIKDYDVLIVGSDQTLNNGLVNISLTFLDFSSKKQKIISYASSFGNNLFLPLDNYYSSLDMERFKKIQVLSLREESEMIKVPSFNTKIRIDGDPTFLLSKAEWEFISTPVFKTPRNYVLLFSFGGDVNLLDDAIEYANANNFEIFEATTFRKNADKRIKQIKNISPTQLIDLISKAKCVFTKSYHGFIISLNLGTNVVCKHDHDARFQSVIDRYRILLTKTNNNNFFVNQSKNNHLGEMIDKDRIVSMSYLKGEIYGYNK